MEVLAVVYIFFLYPSGIGWPTWADTAEKAGY